MQKTWIVLSGWLVLLGSMAGGDSCAMADEPTAQTVLEKLQRQLDRKYADSDCDRIMTDLVGDLASLKYAPAKRAVYRTVFFWFGFDDTMTAHPRLFALKAELEKGITRRALKVTADLDDVEAHCMVFLTNRTELAANPKAKPQYTSLVAIDTTTRFAGDGVRERKQIAAKLNIPAGCVGLKYGITRQGKDSSASVNNLDERLGVQPAHFLMWKVCEFLKHSRDANADRFLRWAVENQRLDRELASELLPDLFPPVKRPSYAVLLRDAKYLAVKITAHFELEKLKQYTSRKPGSFKDLLDAGVLSKADTARIALHQFEGFTWRQNIAFSRRYEFSIRYSGNMLAKITFNHLKQVVNSEDETDTSPDIPADVKIMWSVDKNGRSPQKAIGAASRVFNTVKLKGMHRDKIFKLIGDPSRRPEGVYNRPFWPVGDGETPFRFDTGAYGWQFNLSFDKQGICTGVTRKWIH